MKENALVTRRRLLEIGHRVHRRSLDQFPAAVWHQPTDLTAASFLARSKP